MPCGCSECPSDCDCCGCCMGACSCCYHAAGCKHTCECSSGANCCCQSGKVRVRCVFMSVLVVTRCSDMLMLHFLCGALLTRWNLLCVLAPTIRIRLVASFYNVLRTAYGLFHSVSPWWMRDWHHLQARALRQEVITTCKCWMMDGSGRSNGIRIRMQRESENWKLVLVCEWLSQVYGF
jgi:hypothetical protein